MRIFLTALVFLGVLFLTFGDKISYQVNNVLDGDTIVLHPLSKPFSNFKVRIWGIDTPEKFDTYKLHEQAQKCGVSIEEVRKLGKLASQHAKMYLSPGLIVSVEPVEQDMFGRLVAKIYINGEDYGLKMVKEGYACVYWDSTNDKYVKAMKEAKQYEKGLWFIAPKLMECLCSP